MPYYIEFKLRFTDDHSHEKSFIHESNEWAGPFFPLPLHFFALQTTMFYFIFFLYFVFIIFQVNDGSVVGNDEIKVQIAEYVNKSLFQICGICFKVNFPFFLQ